MERWKKHKVLALLLAVLLFLSAGLSSWDSRAEDLPETTETVAEMTEEDPMEDVQPTSDETDVDEPAEAPAEEGDVSEEEDLTDQADEADIPAAEDTSAEKEADVEAPAADFVPAEETGSEDVAPTAEEPKYAPGVNVQESEEIIYESDGVALIQKMVAIALNANPDPADGGGHTPGSEYVQNMGRSNLDKDTVVFTHKDASGNIIQSNPMVQAGLDQYTNAICARFAGSPGDTNYEFDVDVSEVTETEAKQLIYGLVNAINNGELTYGQAHRLLCYALGNSMVTIGAMPDPKKNNTEYDTATAGAAHKHKLITADDIPLSGVTLINTYKAKAIPANVDFTAYFLKQDTGVSTNWGTYQDFVSWSLTVHEDLHYCAAIYKQNEVGEPMNNVTFDIGVNCGRTTTDTGIKTGKFYNYTSKYSYANHTYSTDANPAPIEDGILVIYLGLYPENTLAPTCYVEEKWIDEGYAKNTGLGYVRVFSGNTIEEAERAATQYALKKLADTTWTNTRTVSLTVKKDYDAAAKLFLETKRPNGNKWTNPNYSLEGAVYAVYSSEEDANNKRNARATFKTNKNGVGIVDYVSGYMTGLGTNTLSHLGQHKWWVREIEAPTGLEVDDTVYELDITWETTENLVFNWQTTDKIEVDPIQININKLNAAGEVMANNGDYNLAGAQFTMKYWPYDVTDNYEESDFRTWMAQGWEPQRTWVFETKLENGTYRIAYDDVFKVSGDDLFYTTAGNPGLPLGWITIEETKAPDGFTMTNGKWIFVDGNDREFDLGGNMLVAKTTADGKLVAGNGLDLTDGTLNNANVPERGDVEVYKVDENGEPMEGVMFKITNKDTGEEHIIATDANGYSSTAAAYQKHSENTGYYDNGAAYDGTKAGVWFAKNKTGPDTPVDDDFGALCPGDYTIEEIETTANDGYQYEAAKEFTITGKETEAESFNFVNYPAPEFSSLLLSDGTGSHTLEKSDSITLTDTITYKNLKAGETYTIRGQLKLVDKDGNMTDYGPEVTKTFTTDAAWMVSPFEKSGTEKIQYTGVKYDDVIDKYLVSYQRLYLGDTADDTNVKQYDGYPAGSRMTTLFPLIDEDKTNEDQIVTAVTGHTTAMAPDSSETLTSVGTVTLTDRVYFSGLILGKEYELTSVLHVRPKNATGNEVYTQEELDAMRLLDENGKPITATKKFTATVSEGYEDVTFTFDASVLKNKSTTLVCFESMKVLPEEIEVFAESDIFDEEQSKPVPAISTTAKSIDDREEKLMAFDDGNFIDTVDVFNVAPNKKWVLEAIAYDKNTKKPLILNGKTVEATKEFTSGDGNNEHGYWDGQVDVEFTISEDQFDDLKGKDIVVFEELYAAGNLKARHTELDDKGQELYVPEIHTELTDDKTKTHIAYPDEEVHFTDTVTYKNLIPGKQYQMDGILYDKETGKPMLDENGNQITGSTPFTASATGEGTVEVKFTFNAKLLMVEGKSFVVFEDCYTLPGYRRVATHSELDDKGQEIDFPKVGTKASITGKTVDENNKLKEIEVTDVLSYEKLQPGLTYIIRATLMKPDGTPAMANGKAVTAEKTFNPAKADGTESITFASFAPEWNVDYDITEMRTAPDGSKYEYTKQGWSFKYVVFEEVYVVKDGEEHLIGDHKNLEDISQTVTDTKNQEGGQPTTGDETPIIWLSLMFLVSAAGIALILWRKRKTN